MCTQDSKNNHCFHPTMTLLSKINQLKSSNIADELKTQRLYNMTNNQPICWFIEKDVRKGRKGYLMGPLFANVLPKQKVILLVREPSKQTISFVSEGNTANDIDSRMYQVYTSHKQYLQLRQAAMDMYNDLEKLSDESLKKELTTNFLNSKIMKRYFKTYYYKAAVDDVLTIDSGKREDKSFSTTVHISSFLLFLYAYDEAFGYNNYNNFVLIQHEWLYSDIIDGLVTIKCWLQTGKRLHTDRTSIINEKNDKDYNYNQCKRIWFDNKDYYNEMIDFFEKRTNYKVNAWTHKGFEMRQEYIEKFHAFYKPFVNAFLIVLQQRQEVLLGKWIDWKGYD